MADIIDVGNKQDKWTIRATELLNWLNDNKQSVLVAGSNITLTPLQDSTVRIDASGGGGGSSTLAELTDVNLSNPSDNQVLVYDATNQEWVNANQSGGGNYHQYSTTEQVIGEWIDGKPIYEITIDCGTLPNATSSPITTPSNIKYITRYEGFCYSNTDVTYQRPIPLAAGGANDIRVDLTAGTLRIVTTADWRTYKGYVTIQYTKTTD